MTPIQPRYPLRDALAHRPAHKHRTIQFSKSFTTFHSRTPRGVQKRRRTIPSLLRFPTRLDTFFSSPGFHSTGRHPKAATRKTNEQTTYHRSDPMQIVLLHRCKTVLSNVDVGATLLEKGATFADSAGRSSATIHDWGAGAACGIRKKAQTGLTEGLVTAFP